MGTVITSLLTRGNKVTAEGRPILPLESTGLPDRLQAALQQFIDRCAQGLHILTGPPNEVVESAKAQLLAAEPIDLLLHELVRQGVVPLAAACTFQRLSYARCLLERTFGPIIAVTSRDTEFANEIHDAAAALDTAVILQPAPSWHGDSRQRALRRIDRARDAHDQDSGSTPPGRREAGG